ncbi:MAG: hypothetical protein M1129_04185 [Candidatus Thermoplasmatota archaeon]|nr:hypothetical protein [Candidatus Thermoplasmatota archaeon]MCL5955203.1 hypothetical protein [Candidatus Thermoplasmatota archaeon]
MKVYSERFPIKYLFSNYGICLGVDTKKASYLFLMSKMGIILQKRPVGDTVVEDLDYEIPMIHEKLTHKQ